MAVHPSDSEVQRRAEPELIRAVAETIGVELTRQTLRLPVGGTVQIDGCNVDQKVACEAFARIGVLNSGQKRKLGNDILKLLLVERCFGGSWRKVLVIAGDDALASLTGGSWQAQALREFGFEVFRVPLSQALAAEIVAVQSQQVMTNVVVATA